MKYTTTNVENIITNNNNINNNNNNNITSSTTTTTTTSSLLAAISNNTTTSSIYASSALNSTTNGGVGIVGCGASTSSSSSLSSSTSSASSASSGTATASNTPNTSSANATNSNTGANQLFCEQVNTVTSLFEKWNDCERTVVMYALLKRLRYPSLKFLQYSIDNIQLTQNMMDSTSNLSTVVIEMNANNPSYLQNLLNAYKTFHLGDLVDTLSSSSSSDKDSMPCYGSDFQLTHCVGASGGGGGGAAIAVNDNCKLYSKKEDILHEVLNMLPLLKPGNDEAKLIYLSLIPLAIKDTIRHIVPIELVQQLFSYMLIHPAVSSDDRRSLNVWLRHLEDHVQNSNCLSLNFGIAAPTQNILQQQQHQQQHTSSAAAAAAAANFMTNQNNLVGGFLLDNTNMTTSGSSATSSSSSALSISSTVSNISQNSAIASSFGSSSMNSNNNNNSSLLMGSRNNDWQTIQPPSKQQQSKNCLTTDWSSLLVVPSGAAASSSKTNNLSASSNIADQLCDNLNGITLNELAAASASSQNSLGLSLNASSLVDSFGGAGGVGGGGSGGVSAAVVGLVDNNSSSLVNGVAAAASAVGSANSSTVNNHLFGSAAQANPIINIISNTNSNCMGGASITANLCGTLDDHDTSFSKNGTEILDFDPQPPQHHSMQQHQHQHNSNNFISSCDSCTGSNNIGQLQSQTQYSVQQHHQHHQHHHHHPPPPPQQQQQMAYASILMSNCSSSSGAAGPDHLDINRWSLDSKFAGLKTRRSNSLTTQTISSSASSSNSSVVTVNDNCSNSTENLAQFANKPRSFSLSIEHHRGSLTNSGSDTRLDDFKPNYVKFQSRNVGMSNIGLWLKSLRLHKYIELFKNMTYEDMLQISEEYLQSLGVTKGASHKLALCIEKLKDRASHLAKMEQELMNGTLKLQAVVEELAKIVFTPMKPIEAAAAAVTNAANAGDDNVALMFLKVIDLVCSIAQKDPYALVDDDNISVILWILDRSIHNEAFVNQANQLKELKFKLSKLKMSLAPKMHHNKNGSNGNLNKPSFQFSRWNGKTRKCDSKNGSNDRINHRKNSNDMLNFSLSCLQQQHHHNQQQQQMQQQLNDYEKYHANSNSNNNNNNISNNNQYKNSAYQNYQQQQQQQQQQPQLQHVHFPALPQHQPTSSSSSSQQQQQQSNQSQQQQHRHLIAVAGAGVAQQPQKMIFKSGQQPHLANHTTDDLQIERMKAQATAQQPRKASLTVINSSGSSSNNNSSNNSAESLHLQQFQPNTSTAAATTMQSPMANTKKTMAAVVMVSNTDDLMQQQVGNVATPPPTLTPQILVTSNNSSNSNSSSSSSTNSNSSSSSSSSSNNGQQQQLQPTNTNLNDINSLDQLETLCLQMTEQAIN